MRPRMPCVLAVAFTLVIGCGPLGADFDGYVAKPVMCDPTAPQSADPRTHVRCRESETCVAATADGEVSSSTTTCFSSKGYTERAACEYANDCGAGFVCTGLGCLRWCRVATGTCEDGGLCLPFSNSPTVVNGEAFGFCAPPTCDPLTRGCAGACWFYAADRTACFPRAGTKPSGEKCEWDNDCAKGFACGAQGICTPYCRVGQSDCGGKRCKQIDGEALSLDGVAYGYCEQ